MGSMADQMIDEQTGEVIEAQAPQRRGSSLIQTRSDKARMVLSGLFEGGAVAPRLLAAFEGDDRAAQKFMSAAVLAIDSSADVQKCHPTSILRSLYHCAQMGAVPAASGVPQTQAEAYLIPRGGECTVMPGWRYFSRRFERHPDVQRCVVRLVFDDDTFEIDEDQNVSTHEPSDVFRALSPSLDGLRGGYVELRMVDGTKRTHFVGLDRIERARRQGASNGPWKTDVLAMVRKTIIRAAASADLVDLGGDQRMAAAFRAEGAAEGWGPAVDVEGVPRTRLERPTGPRAAAANYGGAA